MLVVEKMHLKKCVHNHYKSLKLRVQVHKVLKKCIENVKKILKKQLF